MTWRPDDAEAARQGIKQSRGRGAAGTAGGAIAAAELSTKNDGVKQCIRDRSDQLAAYLRVPARAVPEQHIAVSNGCEGRNGIFNIDTR